MNSLLFFFGLDGRRFRRFRCDVPSDAARGGGVGAARGAGAQGDEDVRGVAKVEEDDRFDDHRTQGPRRQQGECQGSEKDQEGRK